MKTDETMKATLIQMAEVELASVLERGQSLEAGDLMGAEEEVLKMVFRLGRTVVEEIINQQTEQEVPEKRRVGKCGHEQRWMGKRPKQVLTLLGKSGCDGRITAVSETRARRKSGQAVHMERHPPMRCGA